MKIEGYNHIPEITKELDYLNKHQVAIGYFGEHESRLLTIVGANEFGATIKPKNGKWLWIPTKECPRGKGPKDIQGLFIPKGHRVACVNNNGKLVAYFYLSKLVQIPARPFIRQAYMNNKAKYTKLVRHGITQIFLGRLTGEQLLNRLGLVCTADIAKASIRLKHPANRPVTIERKGSDNPLVDTGELQRKVTYKILHV